MLEGVNLARLYGAFHGCHHVRLVLDRFFALAYPRRRHALTMAHPSPAAHLLAWPSPATRCLRFGQPDETTTPRRVSGRAHSRACARARHGGAPSLILKSADGLDHCLGAQHCTLQRGGVGAFDVVAAGPQARDKELGGPLQAPGARFSITVPRACNSLAPRGARAGRPWARTCCVRASRLRSGLALSTKASRPAGPPSCPRSNTNWAGASGPVRRASRGWGRRRAPAGVAAWAYTVVMASKRRAWAWVAQAARRAGSSPASPVACVSRRAASPGGQARMTCSKAGAASPVAN